MEDKRLLDEFDICQPGSNDLLDDELAPLRAVLERDPVAREKFDRRQRLDARLKEAFHDVPTPAGLEDRLLAALAAAEAAGGEAEFSDDETSAVTAPALEKRRVGNRPMWVAAALGAAVAACFGFIAFFLQSDELSPTDAMTLAVAHYNAADGELREGTSQQFPLSPAINQRRLAGWRKANWLEADRSGAIYELRSGGVQAALFVTRFRGARDQVAWAARTGPPAQPEPWTGSLQVAAWQEVPAADTGPMLYVLVLDGGVRGGEHALRNYSQFLRSGLARLRGDRCSTLLAACF